jgi:hypothetical protein
MLFAFILFLLSVYILLGDEPQGYQQQGYAPPISAYGQPYRGGVYNLS